MSTLGQLRAQIADDLVRDDLETQIATEIANAIRAFSSEPFWFNFDNTMTFATEAGRYAYDPSYDEDIELIYAIDEMQLLYQGRSLYIEPDTLARLERLSANGTISERGVPDYFSFDSDTIRLYPIPEDVWTVTVVGTIARPPPASDGETGNWWMTAAYELIRCRAKAYLAAHTIIDDALLQRMSLAEEAAMKTLLRKSGRKGMTGRIQPTSW